MTERIPQEELDKNYRNFIRRVAGLLILAMAEEDVDFATVGARLDWGEDRVRETILNYIEAKTEEGREAVDIMYALGQRVTIELRTLPRQYRQSDDRTDANPASTGA